MQLHIYNGPLSRGAGPGMHAYANAQHVNLNATVHFKNDGCTSMDSRRTTLLERVRQIHPSIEEARGPSGREWEEVLRATGRGPTSSRGGRPVKSPRLSCRDAPEAPAATTAAEGGEEATADGRGRPSGRVPLNKQRAARRQLRDPRFKAAAGC